MRIHFAWSGLEAALENENATQAEIDVVLDGLRNTAIPYAGDDSDHDHTNQVCVAGGVACVAGLLSLVGAGACAAGGIACLGAAACELADCSGDGYN